MHGYFGHEIRNDQLSGSEEIIRGPTIFCLLHYLLFAWLGNNTVYAYLNEIFPLPTLKALATQYGKNRSPT